MFTDRPACLSAVRARDRRFDGIFFMAVASTGIYCRPSCPATTPRPDQLSFYPTAASAQAAGYRACKRCRPDAVPGSPDWDVRADVVARMVRLIHDGVFDRSGTAGLAVRLGFSVRQLQRLTVAELGCSPARLARSHRAQTARVLLETTSLPVADVAFAAGFGSLRSFSDTIGQVYRLTPGQLRARSRSGRQAPTGAGPLAAIDLRLPVRRPLELGNLFGHLVATAVPGVEEWRDGAYRRTLSLPHGPGIVALRPAGDHIAARLWLTDHRDLSPAVARCRRLLDLDADPTAVDAALSADPVLRPLVSGAPGRRVPRTVDGAELTLRMVIGQQVSTAAARTHAARLVVRFGVPVDDPAGGLTHLFPAPAALADLPDDALAMPASRRRTLRAVASALAGGQLDVGPGADRAQTRRQLGQLSGIGPWTVEMVAMRALGDPDAFPATDLGTHRGMAVLGLAPRQAAAWRPWRSYAVQHLWALDDHPINRFPEDT